MIARRIADTAEHLRDLADRELAEHGRDERSRITAYRLQLLARMVDQDAVLAERLENSVVPASARAGLSVVTSEAADG